MKAFAKAFKPTISEPMQDAGRRFESDVRSAFKDREPGRSIFSEGARPPSLDLRLRTKDDGFSLELGGMAGLLEEGGKTRPTQIEPRRRRALKLEGLGPTAFAKRVKHPGSKVPKTETAEKELAKVERALPRQVDRSIQQVIARHRLD